MPNEVAVPSTSAAAVITIMTFRKIPANRAWRSMFRVPRIDSDFYHKCDRIEAAGVRLRRCVVGSEVAPQKELTRPEGTSGRVEKIGAGVEGGRTRRSALKLSVVADLLG